MNLIKMEKELVLEICKAIKENKTGHKFIISEIVHKKINELVFGKKGAK